MKYANLNLCSFSKNKIIVKDVVNDDINVNAKVVAITKDKLQAIVKVADLVVKVVHEKRRGRPTLAEASLKLN